MKSLKLLNEKTLLVIIILFAGSVQAQVTDTVPHKSLISQQYLPQYSLKSDAANDALIENRLVELALKQPQYEQTEYQQKILEYQIKKQKNTWLNLLSISTTYNDQSFAPKSNQTSTTAYVYPKYFFGVTVPLGLIFSNNTDIKITRQSALIAKDQQEELAKTIKATVLSNYKQYKVLVKLLAIQNQVIDDEQSGFIQTEQKFRDGTVTLEVYNDAAKKYNDEVVKVINLQLQQDLVKLEIERLIGRNLEDVLK